MGSAEKQAGLWGARAEDWAEAQEGKVEPLYQSVIERFVKSGTRVLDVGCGAGGFLALAVAKGAKVAGLDGTPELLAIAKRRLPNVRFEHGDLEVLPFEDGAFDLVTGFNSFQYAENPTKALEEARRVLAPGGHVVVATWGKAEDCEAAGYMIALKPLLPPPPPGAAPGGPFALSDEKVLRSMVERAGLAALDVRDVDCPWVYATEADALRGLMSSGPLVMAMNTSGEPKVRAATLESIAPFRAANGGYRLENKFRYVVAQR